MENKKPYIIVFSVVCLILIVSIFLYSKTQTNKAGTVYKQGMEFYNKQDYRNAYYNLNKVSFFSEYFAPSLYRQATSAFELNDTKTALRKYSNFAIISKNTHLSSLALWRIALLQMDLKNYKKAKKTLLKLREIYPDSDFAHAASYKLATILFETDKMTAKQYFIEYLQYAPRGRYSSDAVNKLQTYEDSILADEDRYYIARSLYENELYKKSLLELNEIPFNFSWVYLVKIYDKIGDNSALQKTILKGISQKQQLSKPDEREILDIMLLYIKKSNIPPKTAAHNLVAQTRGNSFYPLALFIHSKYSDKMTAAKNYAQIYTTYPSSIVAPDALWYNFWTFYKAGSLEHALKLSNHYPNLYDDINICPKILFWSAKLHLRNGQKKVAKADLQKIVHDFPSSYYAFRANAMLKGIKNPWNAPFDDEIKGGAFKLDFPLDSSTKEYRMLNKFAALKDYTAISDFKIDDDFLNSWLFAMQGNRPYSVVLARDAINEAKGKISFSSSKFKLAYPLYYKDLINDYAGTYRVNPFLMIALAREESFFNPNAISPTGARGLMQLMPATAQMIANDFRGANALYEPDYNISLGVKYFAYLVNEFKGNHALAVLAYNSGPGSVQKWLRDLNRADFDEFVEDIPYSETANYIKKVYASYWCYKNIYDRF